MRKAASIVLMLVLLAVTATGSADIQPPPDPANLSQKEKSALIAIYESLIEESQPIAIGSSEEELLKRLGQPDGTMTIGDRKRLSYAKGSIIVSDSRIVAINDIPQELLTTPNPQAYQDYQMALGKVFYMGEWMTHSQALESYSKAVRDNQLTQKRITMGKSAKGAREQQIAISKTPYHVFKRNGAAIHLAELLAPGMVTIIDFYADWCAPCKAIDPYLRGLSQDPQVAVRKVDIVGWGSPVAKQWGLKSIPNMRVYDKNGQPVGQPTHDIREIYASIRRAKNN